MNFCPCCGHNFEADKPIQRGRWELGLNWTRLDGKPCQITPQQSAILHTVAACDNGVEMTAIVNRVSSTENDNVVNAQLSRMRKLFGHMMPVKLFRGRGYLWVGQ